LFAEIFWLRESDNARTRRKVSTLAFILVIISNFVGFEVLTAVVMKSTIFWDIMYCTAS
jgi:hypothetical protein